MQTEHNDDDAFDFTEHNIQHIIKLQSYIRGFLQRNIIVIPSSLYQTKQWRKSRAWYFTGKSNECEKYQVQLAESITRQKLLKTNFRINMMSFDLINILHPLKQLDGFEITENFDGMFHYNNNTYYFNLKFVCDDGGAQTRTCREVYHFIHSQLNHITKTNATNIYFVNILDGNTMFKFMNKYVYLLDKQQYQNIRQQVFIGDMCAFQKKWKKEVQNNVFTF